MQVSAETTGNCVVCGAHLDARPYFCSAVIALHRCETCGSLTALPRPTVSQQTNRHDTAEYFEHPYFVNRRASLSATERRCRLIFKEIGRAMDMSHLQGERHLDVGCDTGALALAFARLYGTLPTGVDVSRHAILEALR